MWYKVKELFNKGLSKSQIAIEVGIHRKTVRKYLNMSEEEFFQWLHHPKNLPKKLNKYYEYVRKLLEAHPYLSAAQVEDRLKEDFRDMPQVHSKTVYNFTESIRKRYGIKKQQTKQRHYEKLPEPDYGQYAQADFGEYSMQTQLSGHKKVYFFVMVLCRSRQKFVYFQTTPFTSSSTVRAHEKAFRYFEGQPKKIIYDQDRVLIVDENLGDILLTQEFKSFCGQMDFEPVFCRKSDPESKGKVENAVKFVKYNFLRGRQYFGDDQLNKSAQEWLRRTANAKEHAGIKKIPMNEWEIEKNYLQSLRPFSDILNQGSLPKYKVRKDNTISYKSNFYTLPLGSYKNQDTWVFLRDDQEEVRIYDQDNYLLTVHPLCNQRGKTIRNNDHTRDKSQSIAQLKETVLKMLPDKHKGEAFIERLYHEKPRYVRDNLLLLKKNLPGYEPEVIKQSLDFCLENSLYNAARFSEVANHIKQEQEHKVNIKSIIPASVSKNSGDLLQFKPQTSKLSTYENIL